MAASSLVKYDDKFLVPVSTVTINTTMPPSVNGECVRPTYSIALNGYLIYNAGSPTSSGLFGNYTAEQCETINSDYRLNALLAKHCAINTLFQQQYKKLELGTVAGSPNLTAYPRVLDFALTDTANPSYWTYTVNLEAPDLFCNGVSISPSGSGCYAIKSFEESWDISYDESEFLSEYGENRLFTVSHQISAIGVGIAGTSGLTTSPYLSAKDFVSSRKGANAIIPSVAISGFSSSGAVYNYNEAHSIDPPNGSYAVTEKWITCNTPYIENYSIEIQDSADIACPTVSIQGTIRGFEIRSASGTVPSGTSRYANANMRWEAMQSGYEVYTRATGESGYNLNPNPVNSTVSKNKYNGEINYNRTYKNQQFRFLTSAKSENISYGANWGEDSFATIQLLNGGQVLHPLNYDNSGILRGKNLNKATLSINAIYPCGTGIIGRKGPRFTLPYTGFVSPGITGILDPSGEIVSVINYYNPTGDLTNWFTVVESQSETWIPADGSYSYNVSFVSQPTGNCDLFFN